MNRHPYAALGDLCDVSIGRTPRRSEPRYWGGPHPWATIRDLDGGTLTATGQGITDFAISEVMPKPVEPNTLLFSFKLSIGKMAFAGKPMHHNEAIAALPIRNPDVLDSEFLFYALKARTHDETSNHAVLGKVLNKRKVEEIEILLPPLDEQRRIVGILHKVAKIEKLRAQATESLREFMPALFIKVFGDPAENPMGWDVRLLGDLIHGIQGGKNVQAGSGESEFRILKVSAVTDGIFDPSKSKPAPDDYIAPKDHFVRSGDLLISRANTSLLVGASALVEDEAENVLLPDKIWRLVWRSNSAIEPSYLHSFLNTLSIRATLSAMATGTSGSMKNITKSKLQRLQILVPPLSVQRGYANAAMIARSISSRSRSFSMEASALMSSLMDRFLRDGV